MGSSSSPATYAMGGTRAGRFIARVITDVTYGHTFFFLCRHAHASVCADCERMSSVAQAIARAEKRMRLYQMVGLITYGIAFGTQGVIIARCLATARRRGESYVPPPVAGFTVWCAALSGVAWCVWAINLARMRRLKNEHLNPTSAPTWPVVVSNLISTMSTIALAISMIVFAPRSSWFPACRVNAA